MAGSGRTAGATTGTPRPNRRCGQRLRGQPLRGSVPGTRVYAQVAQRQYRRLDGRTTQHEGYAIRPHKRKRVEPPFGWRKTFGRLHKLRHRGRDYVTWLLRWTATADNITRMKALMAGPRRNGAQLNGQRYCRHHQPRQRRCCGNARRRNRRWQRFGDLTESLRIREFQRFFNRLIVRITDAIRCAEYGPLMQAL